MKSSALIAAVLLALTLSACGKETAAPEAAPAVEAAPATPATPGPSAADPEPPTSKK